MESRAQQTYKLQKAKQRLVGATRARDFAVMTEARSEMEMMKVARQLGDSIGSINEKHRQELIDMITIAEKF